MLYSRIRPRASALISISQSGTQLTERRPRSAEQKQREHFCLFLGVTRFSIELSLRLIGRKSDRPLLESESSEVWHTIGHTESSVGDPTNSQRLGRWSSRLCKKKPKPKNRIKLSKRASEDLAPLPSLFFDGPKISLLSHRFSRGSSQMKSVTQSFLRLGMVVCLTVSFLVTCAPAQSPADYERLVGQGKAQLEDGDSDAALSSAKAAIKMNGSRWEAHALAGGALMNLKRYQAADGELALAILGSPPEKQTAIAELRTRCEAAMNSAAQEPSTLASQAEPQTPPLHDILTWIANNLPTRTLDQRYEEEMTFTGCTVVDTMTGISYGTESRPPDKKSVVITTIDLTKLSPESVKSMATPPGSPGRNAGYAAAIVFHSDKGITTHVRDWIRLSGKDETQYRPYENTQPAQDFFSLMQDNDMATRMLHAWHDAIRKCAAKAVPANLY